MSGILRIAYKLLVNDKGKFIALLMGITFSVFLMIQMTSMFAGMMKKAVATVTNTGRQDVGDGPRPSPTWPPASRCRTTCSMPSAASTG